MSPGFSRCRLLLPFTRTNLSMLNRSLDVCADHQERYSLSTSELFNAQVIRLPVHLSVDQTAAAPMEVLVKSSQTQAWGMWGAVGADRVVERKLRVVPMETRHALAVRAVDAVCRAIHVLVLAVSLASLIHIISEKVLTCVPQVP